MKSYEVVSVTNKTGVETVMTKGHLTEKEAETIASKLTRHAFRTIYVRPSEEMSVKKNPAPRIGTARPKRLSQATRKPPDKRLVVRRKKNTEKGYFPNPAPVTVKFKITQTSYTGKTEIVCYSKTEKSAIALVRHFNSQARPGVRFNVLSA